MSDSRVALVTGAASGIGAATALALAERGLRVVLAVRQPHKANEVLAQIESLGGAATAVPCDVGDYASAQAAVQQAINAYGRLDALVNNAGVIAPIGLIDQTEPAEWAQAITVNLTGVYYMVHASLPHLLRSPAPSIVNVSTGASVRPLEGWSAYSASKAGAAMFTRSLHLEYGENVAIYGLQPGVVDTPMQGKIRASGINPVSQLTREQLDPPQKSASAIAWLTDHQPQDLRGQELTVRDQSLMSRISPNTI